MKRSEALEIMNKVFKEEYCGKTFEQVNDLMLQALEHYGIQHDGVLWEVEDEHIEK